MEGEMNDFNLVKVILLLVGFEWVVELVFLVNVLMI